MKIYHFTITLSGGGNTPEEAWIDACEGFELDPGCMPEGGDTELVEDDEE